MPSLRHVSEPPLAPRWVIPRRLGRLLWRLAVWLVALCLAIALGFTLFAVNTLPPLQPWHTVRLHEEFSAYKHADLDFDGYLKQEAKLFEEYRSTVSKWDRQDEAFAHSRFNPAGMMNRLAEGAPYNRTFRLTLDQPVGHALLLHGLTDSAYSMKALADSLHARGFEVTVLRMPGHGTLPSMMVEMSSRDWTAAVRIAARDVAARAPAGQPFYIGGYSTGGTLALQYALDALQDSSLRRPDRVLLISPAIELTPVAALANVIDIFSVVPIPLLEKVRWQAVAAEFDPYKFNSFPVNGSRQVNRATRTLQRALSNAAEAGRLGQLSPVITWQSVVDSTVGANGAADTLYGRLQGPAHRLVMFDVNRARALRSVTRPAARELIDRLANGSRTTTLELVTNPDPESSRISVQRLAPDSSRSVRETALEWPADLVSLGHVALPFPPDDPVYGFLPGSGRDGIPSIGSWLLRGESGAITIALGSLTRLRSNPFWSLIDADVGQLVASDVAAKKR
jgi:alpha-beta hydrolase superfamily lysophospholipase